MLRALEYKWIALSIAILGVLLATIDTSIMLIATPDVSIRSGSIRWSRETTSTCSGDPRLSSSS
jgi:hypothetical protein